MNDNRSADGNKEPKAHNRDIRQHNSQSIAPMGFEGMNFEQQRGSYRDNVSHSRRQEPGRGNNSGSRHEDL